MIVRARPTALGLLTIMRGSIVPKILPRVIFVLALSSAVVVLHSVFPRAFGDLTPVPFTLLGLALSIFLGFRNNACYERWWEARRQWGQLLAETRALVRDAVSLLPKRDPESSRRTAHRAIAFAHALRSHLRGVDAPELRDWLPPDEWERVAACRSRPDGVLLLQSAAFQDLLRQGALSDVLFGLFSERLRAMTTIQTACERLRSTPTPFTYSLLLHRTAWLFCLLLPFGLVATLGVATPFVSAIMAYAFFGLDALGEELEEPFGLSQNAIPLDALARAIQIAALEALGDRNLPPPLEPRDHLLL